MEKKGGKVRADICLASFHLACSLTNHSPLPSSFIKWEGKMTSLIWQRQTSKPHKPLHPPTPLSATFSLLQDAVCACACYILYFFSQASGLTQRDVEMNPEPLPGFYSLRDIEASHTLWLAGSGVVCVSVYVCLCLCVCVSTGQGCLDTSDSHTQLREQYRTLNTLACPCVLCRHTSTSSKREHHNSMGSNSASLTDLSK